MNMNLVLLDGILVACSGPALGSGHAVLSLWVSIVNCSWQKDGDGTGQANPEESSGNTRFFTPISGPYRGWARIKEYVRRFQGQPLSVLSLRTRPVSQALSLFSNKFSCSTKMKRPQKQWTNSVKGREAGECNVADFVPATKAAGLIMNRMILLGQTKPLPHQYPASSW